MAAAGSAPVATIEPRTRATRNLGRAVIHVLLRAGTPSQYAPWTRMVPPRTYLGADQQRPVAASAAMPGSCCPQTASAPVASPTLLRSSTPSASVLPGPNRSQPRHCRVVGACWRSIASGDREAEGRVTCPPRDSAVLRGEPPGGPVAFARVSGASPSPGHEARRAALRSESRSATRMVWDCAHRTRVTHPLGSRPHRLRSDRRPPGVPDESSSWIARRGPPASNPRIVGTHVATRG